MLDLSYMSFSRYCYLLLLAVSSLVTLLPLAVVVVSNPVTALHLIFNYNEKARPSIQSLTAFLFPSPRILPSLV